MHQKTLKVDVSDLADHFDSERLVFVPGPRLLAIDELREHFFKFAQNWNRLPADQYFIGPKPTRFRRHAKLDLDAETGQLAWRTGSTYFQSIEYNPLFGGITRHFAPIERTAETEAILEALIRLAAESIFKLAGLWLVNVHLVRTVGDPGMCVPPAPEGPHRDGYDVISLHLVDRNNESGGETMILDRSDRLLSTLTLDSPMDTLYMDDKQFRHDVTPIRAAGRSCYRDMILMSYERELTSFEREP